MTRRTLNERHSGILGVYYKKRIISDKIHKRAPEMDKMDKIG